MIPWTVDCQAPLSTELSKQYWSWHFLQMGCHFLLQGIFSTRGSNPRLLHLLHWRCRRVRLLSRLGSPILCRVFHKSSARWWLGQNVRDGFLHMSSTLAGGLESWDLSPHKWPLLYTMTESPDLPFPRGQNQKHHFF